MRQEMQRIGSGCIRLGDIEQGSCTRTAIGSRSPELTIVCGDSRTSTHGAFGALAMGISTSEVEHVLAVPDAAAAAVQTMAVNVDGRLPRRCVGQGHHHQLIAKIGTGGSGQGVSSGSEAAPSKIAVHGRPDDGGRHEAARAGMVARTKPPTRSCVVTTHLARPVGLPHSICWQRHRTDVSAVFDTEVYLDAASLSPFVTWGLNPGQEICRWRPV